MCISEAENVLGVLYRKGGGTPKKGCGTLGSPHQPWFGSREIFRLVSGKGKTHKHKQICGIVPGLGGFQKVICVFFWVILMGEKKHINKIPPQIPGQSREIFVYVFFSLFGDRYDWTTGAPHDGNEWKKYRRTSCSPLAYPSLCLF